ncbi:MAG: hypothetical protein PHQ03_02485 [Methylococcales bacterium]|nr:hypothetical protein [Methylococcales bacterium]
MQCKNTNATNKPVSHLVAATLLLLSGFAGISYEILYGRMLGNLLGDQFAVSASILMTFLLGIGLGAFFAHKLHRWLWLIELGIGLFSLLFVQIFPILERVLYESERFSQSLGSSILVCSALLIIPAFLVGCSVPLFAVLFSRLNEGKHFSSVYSIYNLGAAITALFLEFVLIRIIGIGASLVLFAFINISIAICLRCYFYDDAVSMPVKMQLTFSKKMQLALILASIGSAIFQLYMMKLTELFFGPFRENFALILAVILLGIAFGSHLSTKLKINFAQIMQLNVAGLIFLSIALPWVIWLYAYFYEMAATYHVTIVLFKIAILLILMLIPVVTFGATIPVLLRSEQHVAKDSGYLLFVSALANSVGFLVMVFALHPYLDFGVQLLVIIVLSVFAWLIYTPFRAVNLAKTSLFLLFVIGLHSWFWQENLLYLSYTAFHSTKEMQEAKTSIKKLESFKGNQDIFAINEIDGTAYFFINGYISFPLNSYHEKMVGLLSAMFSPKTDDALVLGLGSGSTASVIGLTFDSTDAVEINPLVRDNLYRLKEWNFDMAHNQRVNFIVDDAIHFVHSTSKTYSLILNTVTSPLYFSSSKLYTDDFYKIIKTHLKPAGIYATWIDSRIGDKGFDIILKTLQQSFNECAMLYIKSAYFLLLCGDEPIVYSQQNLQNRAPQVWEELTQKYGLLPDLMPYNLLTTHAFNLLNNPAVNVNSLDFPVLEYEMASLISGSNWNNVKNNVAAQMNIDEIKQGLVNHYVQWNAFNLVVNAEKILNEKYITKRWRRLLEQSGDAFDVNHDEAELFYYQQLAKIAQSSLAYQKYGAQFMKRGRYVLAIEQFDNALRLDKQSVKVYLGKGVCYEHLGDDVQAIENYLKVLSFEPNNTETVQRLGRIYRDTYYFRDLKMR